MRRISKGAFDLMNEYPVRFNVQQPTAFVKGADAAMQFTVVH